MFQVIHKKVKVKEFCNRPGVAQRVPGGLGSQISWHSAHEGGGVCLTHWPPLPLGNVPVTHFHLGLSRPQGHGMVGRNMSLKNPVTPPGIDPMTVRLVAQHLNHYATPGPHSSYSCFVISKCTWYLEKSVLLLGNFWWCPKILKQTDCNK